jgi:hypothetical protein
MWISPVTKWANGHWGNFFKQLLAVNTARLKLTQDDLIDVLMKQNRRCALTGQFLTCIRGQGFVATNASIDRIIPGGPYTLENIQLVCAAVNQWRGVLPIEEFIRWCQLVVVNRSKQVGFDLGERIKQVRAMEDFIDKKQQALDAELEKHHKFVDMGRAEILAFLNTTNQKSANTEFGGAYWKPKITYRVEDKDAFRRHVIGAEAWELITWASAPVNCEVFTEEHKMPPPGLARNAVNILYITPPTKPKGKNKNVTE